MAYNCKNTKSLLNTSRHFFYVLLLLRFRHHEIHIGDRSVAVSHSRLLSYVHIYSDLRGRRGRNLMVHLVTQLEIKHKTNRRVGATAVCTLCKNSQRGYTRLNWSITHYWFLLCFALCPIFNKNNNKEWQNYSPYWSVYRHRMDPTQFCHIYHYGNTTVDVQQLQIV